MTKGEITIADCLRQARWRLKHGSDSCDCQQDEQGQEDLSIARKYIRMAQRRIEQDTGAPFREYTESNAGGE